MAAFWFTRGRKLIPSGHQENVTGGNERIVTRVLDGRAGGLEGAVQLRSEGLGSVPGDRFAPVVHHLADVLGAADDHAGAEREAHGQRHQHGLSARRIGFSRFIRGLTGPWNRRKSFRGGATTALVSDSALSRPSLQATAEAAGKPSAHRRSALCIQGRTRRPPARRPGWPLQVPELFDLRFSSSCFARNPQNMSTRSKLRERIRETTSDAILMAAEDDLRPTAADPPGEGGRHRRAGGRLGGHALQLLPGSGRSAVLAHAGRTAGQILDQLDELFEGNADGRSRNSSRTSSEVGFEHLDAHHAFFSILFQAEVEREEGRPEAGEPRASMMEFYRRTKILVERGVSPARGPTRVGRASCPGC